METAKKAFTMLAAAVLSRQLKKPKRVVRHGKKPAPSSADLSMPSGTLYDCISREDL